eukprot:78438_1
MSNYSDDSSSNSSKASATASSLSLFERDPDLPSLPPQYQIPKAIMSKLILPDQTTIDNLFTSNTINADITSEPKVPSFGGDILSIQHVGPTPRTTNKSVLKTESTANNHPNHVLDIKMKDEPSLRRSKRKRDTTFDYRNRIDRLFNRNELQTMSLDELLAKAMAFDPDLRWNIENKWCRYCGARASSAFYPSPWGPYQLCAVHGQMWSINRLDLSQYTEPKDSASAIEPSKCTETSYLIDIICANMQSMEDEDTSDASDAFAWNTSRDVKNANHNMKPTKIRKTSSNRSPSNRRYTEYECKVCHKILVTSAVFKEHAARVHGNHRPFDCDQCDKNYLNKSNLDIHIRKIHNKEINAYCPVCQKAFFDSSEMKQHLRRKHKDRKVLKKEDKFVCKYCQQVFTKKYYMKKHILNIHTDNKDKPYQCCYCWYGAATRWQIDIHEAIHRNERSYKCKHCDRGFNNKKNMERHVLNDHVKPYKCKHCDKGFGSKQYLRSHVLNRHTQNKDKPFQCRFCDYGASSQKRVTKHELVHSELKPFKCGQCDKRFKTLQYLHSHLSRVHVKDKIKRFECNVCQKRFTTKSYLKAHILSHSTIKPYKCSECNYATQFKNRLEKHEESHRYEKEHECDICHKRFRLKWYVIAHKKNVHPTGKLTRVSLPRKPKDEMCPKKPLTSYFVYAKHKRPSVKNEFPHFNVIEVSKEISKKWNKLGDDAKRPYDDESRRLKREYTQKMSEFKATERGQKYEKRVKKWKMECARIRKAIRRDELQAMGLQVNEVMDVKREESVKVEAKIESDSDSDSYDSMSSDSESSSEYSESDSDASLSSDYQSSSH